MHLCIFFKNVRRLKEEQCIGRTEETRLLAPYRTGGFLFLAFENRFLDMYSIGSHCDSEFCILKML